MPWTAATVPAASTHAYRLHSSSTAPGSNPTPLGRAQQQLVLRVRILDRAIFVMGKAVPLALGLALLVLPFAAATRTLSFYDSYDFGYLDYGGDEADNTGYGGYSGGYDYPYDDEDYEEPCVEEGEEGGNTEGSGVCVGCAPITAGAHPYFIALATQYNPFGVHCGGTIIAPDIVITAAHCMKIRLRVQVCLRQPRGYQMAVAVQGSYSATHALAGFATDAAPVSTAFMLMDTGANILSSNLSGGAHQLAGGRVPRIRSHTCGDPS